MNWKKERDSFGVAKTAKVRFCLLGERCGSRNKATGYKQLLVPRLKRTHRRDMTSETTNRIDKRRKEISRFLKFSVVGAVGAVIDFGLLNILVQFAGFSKVGANACSFTAAVISNFVWNRLWVYPETREDPLRKQFLQFLVVNLLGLGINTLIFIVSDQWVLGTEGLLAGPVGAVADLIGMEHFDMAYNGAKVIATGVVLFWNFFVNRLWTFRHVE